MCSAEIRVASDRRPRNRSTARKRLLRDCLESQYCGGPVLLDEVRWTVMGQHLERCGEGTANARRSLMNSFARTVREQLHDYKIEKLPISPRTPVGLLARMAVFRMKNSDDVSQFLGKSKGPGVDISIGVGAPLIVRSGRHAVTTDYGSTVE
jgi:hypothetical protein